MCIMIMFCTQTESGSNTPHSDSISPHSDSNTPHSDSINPHSDSNTPHSESNSPHSDSINPHSDSTSTSENSILDSVTSTSTLPSIGTSILEIQPQISREDDEGLVLVTEDCVRLRGDSLTCDVVREEEEDNEDVFLPITQRLSRLQTLPLNIDDVS